MVTYFIWITINHVQPLKFSKVKIPFPKVFSSDEFPHLSSEREEMVEFKAKFKHFVNLNVLIFVV